MPKKSTSRGEEKNRERQRRQPCFPIQLKLSFAEAPVTLKCNYCDGLIDSQQAISSVESMFLPLLLDHQLLMIQATKYCVSLISHPASVFPIVRVPQFHSHHPARSSTQAKSPPPPTPLPRPRGMILAHQTRPARAVSSRPRRWAEMLGPSGPRDGRLVTMDLAGNPSQPGLAASPAETEGRMDTGYGITSWSRLLVQRGW